MLFDPADVKTIQDRGNGGSAENPNPKPRRNIPEGAGRLSDDLSKVQSTDVIGKGGESDLRK
jgi:hypothetical protein